jgi:hypothetical protein
MAPILSGLASIVTEKFALLFWQNPDAFPTEQIGDIASKMIDFSLYHFHPVIPLPPGYEVYDFTQSYDPNRTLKSPYGIGRYNEDRRGMYTSELFASENPEKARTIHVGIDIAAPLGSPVHAFFEGEI